MQVSASDNYARTILFTVPIFVKGQVRSMNSVSFAMLKAEKARVYQRRQTLCWEERFLSDAAVATSYQESRCLFQTGARKRRASNNFCHERINICLCSRSCWCCQLIGHSCSNPVHIHHQYRTESTYAGFKQ